MRAGGHDLSVLGPGGLEGRAEVIFIHGLLATVQYARAGLPPALRKRRWASLGLPGHTPGRLSASCRPESVSTAAWAIAFSEAAERLTEGRPALLVGHSMGGFAALLLAAARPDLVAGVVSVAGAYRGCPTGLYALGHHLARLGPLGRLLCRTGIYLATRTPWNYRLASASHVAAPLNYLADPSTRAVLSASAPTARHFDLNAIVTLFACLPKLDLSGWLGAVEALVLVLHGDRDPTLPPAQARCIAEAVPEADLHWMRDAGHMLMFERPAAYKALIANWLRRHGLSDENR